MLVKEENFLWTKLFFLFLAVGDDNNSIMKLLYSENIENDFNNLLNEWENIDEAEFKKQCLDTLRNSKEIVKDLNKTMLTAKKKEGVRANER